MSYYSHYSHFCFFQRMLTTAVSGGVAFLCAAGSVADGTTKTPSTQDDGTEQHLPYDVVVIGGGVVGVSTAYAVSCPGATATGSVATGSVATAAQKKKRRRRVLVLESQPTLGSACTACSAGGLQRANATVDVHTYIAVARSVLGRMSYPSWSRSWSSSSHQQQQQQGSGRGSDRIPFQFFTLQWQCWTDPFFWRWLAGFTYTSLFASRTAEQQKKQDELLKFTDYAVDLIKTKILQDKMNVGYNTRGSLKVRYGTAAERVDAAGPSTAKRSMEPSRHLNREELLELEPSLRHATDPSPISAEFEFNAAAASAECFTQQLAKQCRPEDVTFQYDTKVLDIDIDPTNSRVTHIHTSRGTLSLSPEAKVVVAMGAWTPRLLAMVDLYVPVYPLTGYAMSIVVNNKASGNHPPAKDLPSRIVSDSVLFTTRILGENENDEVRISSVGELRGWRNTKLTPFLEAAFRQHAARRMPHLAREIEAAPVQMGHRPMVCDGMLLLGRAHYQNLYVSCGPGSNGWKLALGSAMLMEAILSAEENNAAEEKDGSCQYADVFDPAGRIVYSPWFCRLCRAHWEWESSRAVR